MGKPSATTRLRPHRINVHWISQVLREQPIDLGACESHLMAGHILTMYVGTTDKWVQVKKLFGHLISHRIEEG